MLVHTALDKRKQRDDPWLLTHAPFGFNAGSGLGHPILRNWNLTAQKQVM